MPPLDLSSSSKLPESFKDSLEPRNLPLTGRVSRRTSVRGLAPMLSLPRINQRTIFTNPEVVIKLGLSKIVVAVLFKYLCLHVAKNYRLIDHIGIGTFRNQQGKK